MKTLTFCISFILTVSFVHAQETLSRIEAVRAANLFNFDLEKLADTPIPTDGDVKRPFGIKAGERGALLVPECKLTRDTLQRAGKQVVPVGQLWLRNLTLAKDWQPVTRARLNFKTVHHEDKFVRLPLFLLGVRKSANEKLELVIYGKDKNPLVTTALRQTESNQELPLEFSVSPSGNDVAEINLHLVGQYQASFNVVTMLTE